MCFRCRCFATNFCDFSPRTERIKVPIQKHNQTKKRIICWSPDMCGRARYQALQWPCMQEPRPLRPQIPCLTNFSYPFSLNVCSWAIYIYDILDCFFNVLFSWNSFSLYVLDMRFSRHVSDAYVFFRELFFRLFYNTFLLSHAWNFLSSSILVLPLNVDFPNVPFFLLSHAPCFHCFSCFRFFSGSITFFSTSACHHHMKKMFREELWKRTQHRRQDCDASLAIQTVSGACHIVLETRYDDPTMWWKNWGLDFVSACGRNFTFFL